MKKIKNVSGLALLLIALLLNACSNLPSVIQNDPVGASLYAMKSGYEGAVRSAGQAYLAGQIDDTQLKDFMVRARGFYNAYTLSVTLYEADQIGDPQTLIQTLRKALDDLQLYLQSLILKRV